MRALRSPHDGGFSLVELMVCVAIIGILSSIAVPRFQNFMAKAKQSEAKTNLSSLSALQESYFGDNDAYFDGGTGFAATIPTLGFFPSGNARYTYSSCAAGCLGGWTYVSRALAATNNNIRSGCSFKDGWAYGSWPGTGIDMLMFSPGFPTTPIDCSVR